MSSRARRHLHRPLEQQFGERTELRLNCGKAIHTLILNDGQVYFCHHRVPDLEFANALETAPECGCGWVLKALQSHDPTTLAKLPIIYRIELGRPDLCCEARAKDAAIRHQTRPHALLHDTWIRRFRPLEAALWEGCGLQVEIGIHPDRPGPAVSIAAAEGEVLGTYQAGYWTLSRRAVAAAARRTTTTGSPIAFWGEGTCRVCVTRRPDETPDADEPSTWPEPIEELAIPPGNIETIREHALSRPHLDRIVAALDEILGPGAFLDSPDVAVCTRTADKRNRLRGQGRPLPAKRLP
jgi:hypothetical protein